MTQITINNAENKKSLPKNALQTVSTGEFFERFLVVVTDRLQYVKNLRKNMSRYTGGLCSQQLNIILPMSQRGNM